MSDTEDTSKIKRKGWKLSPWGICLVLALSLVGVYGEMQDLENEVRELSILEIEFEVHDESGAVIPNVLTAVRSEYNFDDVKPVYRIGTSGTTKGRIVVAFYRKAFVRFSAPGFLTQSLKITESGPTSMSVVLKSAQHSDKANDGKELKTVK